MDSMPINTHCPHCVYNEKLYDVIPTRIEYSTCHKNTTLQKSLFVLCLLHINLYQFDSHMFVPKGIIPTQPQLDIVRRGLRQLLVEPRGIVE